MLFRFDGTQVAFAWGGEKGGTTDIYLQLVGSPDVRRLTADDLYDWTPKWSPDGRQIAFVHCPAEFCVLHTVSPLGGSDRKLSDYRASPRQISWSPDGRYIAAASFNPRSEPAGVTGIRLIPAEGGSPRVLTPGKAPSFDDAPAFSFAGRHLAFFTCGSTLPLTCHLSVLDLDDAYAPSGPPRRLTSRPILEPGTIAWTRDGHFVIYDAKEIGRAHV